MNTTIENLKTAILKHMDCADDEDFQNTMKDVAAHGADGGVPCFTYTTHCAEFYNANEDAIYELLNDTADDMGHESVDELVGTFQRKDMLSWPDGRKNLLAWFALEEVARAMEDEKEIA